MKPRKRAPLRQAAHAVSLCLSAALVLTALPLAHALPEDPSSPDSELSSRLTPSAEDTELVESVIDETKSITPEKVQQWFSGEAPWKKEVEYPEAPPAGECIPDPGPQHTDDGEEVTLVGVDGLLRCTIASHNMQKDMPVLVRPAPQGGDAAIYFLDGIPAAQSYNGWVAKGEALETFAHDNVTLFFPLGGVAQFYTNWINEIDSPDGIRQAHWESFLTEEVPQFLEQKFGVNPHKNSVAGLSMGATAALNLAAWHSEQFVQASSYSGYLNPSEPSMQFLIARQQWDEGGLHASDMWGGPAHPLRFRNDPTIEVERLRGVSLYISAALGGVAPQDAPELIDEGPLTSTARSTFENRAWRQTKTFETQARSNNVDAVWSYDVRGGHSWTNWKKELRKGRPFMLEALGIQA